MSKKASTEETAVTVVPQQGGEVAAAGMLDAFAAMAGLGSENITSDALAIPFLRLLQAKSPEVEADSDTYKPGMLVHSITGKAYDIREKKGKPLHFVLAHFNKQVIEWGDKDAGNGGIKARHACTPALLQKMETLDRNAKGKVLAPNGTGNTLEETAYHYLITLPEEGPTVGVLPLKSTGLTPSKKLMRTVNDKLMVRGGKTFKPPTFAFVYSVESFLDKRKTGAQETFMNVRFAEVGQLTDMGVFEAAFNFYKSINGGEAKLDDAQEAATESRDRSTVHDANILDGDAPDWVSDDNVKF